MRPVTVTIACACKERTHTVKAWPAAPGLVVKRLGSHCDDLPDHDLWVITHVPTGRALPLNIEGPEAAMACAAEVAGLWDWTTFGVPSGEVRSEVVKVLRRYGARTGGKYDDLRPLERLNGGGGS